MDQALIDGIEKEIKSHKVVMFIKGTAQAPKCGFSAAALDVFKKMNIPVHTVDVMENPQIRRFLPEYSNWPTFPQVFVNGKLIGGCDITQEMYASGELQKLLS
jgi:monothiol glutaredoxin